VVDIASLFIKNPFGGTAFTGCENICIQVSACTYMSLWVKSLSHRLGVFAIVIRVGHW
jgi:hypothetical protein